MPRHEGGEQVACPIGHLFDHRRCDLPHAFVAYKADRREVRRKGGIGGDGKLRLGRNPCSLTQKVFLRVCAFSAQKLHRLEMIGGDEVCCSG